MQTGLFIDLNETPEALPRIPKSNLDVKGLIQSAMQYLVLSGATRPQILASYRDEQTLWPIPATYGLFEGDPQLLPLPPLLAPHDLPNYHKLVRRIVRRDGFGQEALHLTVQAFGPTAAHPMYFSRTTGSRFSVLLFSAELALGLGGYGVGLQNRQMQMYRRIVTPKGVFNVGLDLVKPEDQELYPQVLAALEAPKGLVLHTRFDILDRLKIWLEDNFVPEHKSKIERALAILKLSQNPAVTSAVENAVANLESFEPSYEPEYKEMLFTTDNLSMIRQQWFGSEGVDPYDALKGLYESICPMYIDAYQFQRIFKFPMPARKDYSYRHERLVNQGMEKFTLWFLKQQSTRKKA